MLDNRSYKLLKKFYRKKKLTFEQIQKITDHNESETPSKHISALATSHFITCWNTDEIINGIALHWMENLMLNSAGETADCFGYHI